MYRQQWAAPTQHRHFITATRHNFTHQPPFTSLHHHSTTHVNIFYVTPITNQFTLLSTAKKQTKKHRDTTNCHALTILLFLFLRAWIISQFTVDLVIKVRAKWKLISWWIFSCHTLKFWKSSVVTPTLFRERELSNLTRTTLKVVQGNIFHALFTKYQKEKWTLLRNSFKVK